MIGWLVDERGIKPHVKLMDKSERADGALSRSDFAFDPARSFYVCHGGKELRKYHRSFSKPRDERRHDDLLRAQARLRSLRAQAQVLPEFLRAKSRALFMKLLATRRGRSQRTRPTRSHGANERRSRCSLLT